LTSSDPAAVAFSATTAISNVASGVAAGGPAVLGATFTQGGEVYQADSIVYSAATAILENFSLCWTPIPNPDSVACSTADASLVENRLSPQIQFHAIGNFDGGTLSREITRQVTWTTAGGEAAVTANATVQSGPFTQNTQIQVNPPGPGIGE
jgi:hypothetical protein